MLDHQKSKPLFETGRSSMISPGPQDLGWLTLGAVIAQSERQAGGHAVRVYGAMRQGRSTITIDVETSSGTQALLFDMITQAITVERPVSVMRPAGRK